MIKHEESNKTRGKEVSPGNLKMDQSRYCTCQKNK